MRNIGDKICADLVGNITEALPIQNTGIGGKSGHNQFGIVFQGKTFSFIIINLAGIKIQAILHSIEDTAGNVHAGAVSQMAAMRQAHAHDGIARFDQCQINRTVGL